MGTLTPAAEIKMKQFWYEEKETSKWKSTGEMSCSRLPKEKWTEMCVDICSCAWTPSPGDPWRGVGFGDTDSSVFSQVDKD